jgi:hypothetical protein
MPTPTWQYSAGVIPLVPDPSVVGLRPHAAISAAFVFNRDLSDA